MIQSGLTSLSSQSIIGGIQLPASVMMSNTEHMIDGNTPNSFITCDACTNRCSNTCSVCSIGCVSNGC